MLPLSNDSKAQQQSTERDGGMREEGRREQTLSTNNKKEPRHRKAFRQVRQDWPRLTALLLQVLLPMFFIVGICFACGSILARIESPEEIAANDKEIADRFNHSISAHLLAEQATKGAKTCLARFKEEEQEVFTIESFERFLTGSCESELAARAFGYRDDLIDYLFQINSGLGFSWTLCTSNDEPIGRDYKSQMTHVLDAWMISFLSFFDKRDLHDNVLQAFRSPQYEAALKKATGHGQCSHHTAAGALFWFIVTTTVGYGNQAPVTNGGRSFVFVCGFISILLWAIITAHASSVCLAINDDFCLKRKRLKRFVKGVAAWMLYLLFFWIWLYFMSFIVYLWEQSRLTDTLGRNAEYRRQDAFWFSFISITTVGLGDYYIPPQEVQTAEMVYIPLVFLSGFIVLTNFLKKFSYWVIHIRLHMGKPLAEILQEKREQEQRDAASTESPETATFDEEEFDNHACSEHAKA